MDTIAALRDGIREKELSDLGIESEVRWENSDRVTVVLSLDGLDELISGPAHECEYDQHDLAEAGSEGYHEGYAAALADIKKLAAA